MSANSDVTSSLRGPRQLARVARWFGTAVATKVLMVEGLPEWNEIARYDAALPRYTSYPTVPNWGPMGGEDVSEALGRVTEPEVALYIHLPFCSRLCSYCGCHSLVTRDAQRVRDYVQLVLQELQLVKAKLATRPLRQLHLGGGTPTYLNPTLLNELLTGVLAAYPPAPGAELAVEVDPSVVEDEHLRVLRGHGFNRLSMGVQDLDEHVQELIGRHQPASVAIRALEMSRKLGFESVNMDLMYGLPGQSQESIAHTADWAARLGPDRLSLFGYAHVPSMKPQQRVLERHGLPGQEARWDMLRVAHQTLQSRGYVPIGIDHFATPEDELVKAKQEDRLWRNFQGYTVLGAVPLVGLGISAISDVGGAYAQNVKSISEYRGRLSEGMLATERGLPRSPDDELRRYVITELMCNMGVGFEKTERAFGLSFARVFADELIAVEELAADGLCRVSDEAITLTEKGRPLARVIAAVFDAYLRDKASGSPRFSSVV